MKKSYLVIAILFGFLFIAHAQTEPETIIDNRPAMIDKYFSDRGMPLAGHGRTFVEVADKYGIDWRLLPALSIREQSGGKVLPHNCPGHTINYNAFGYGSGKNCFTSFDEAIEFVGMKLGTGKYYVGKDTLHKLQTYNPPSVVPRYAYEVISIMNAISDDKTVTK